MPLACNTTPLLPYCFTTASCPSPHRYSLSLHVICDVGHDLYPLLPYNLCFTMAVYPTVSLHLPIACCATRSTRALHIATFPTDIPWNHTHRASVSHTTLHAGFSPCVAPSHCTLSVRHITPPFIRHSAPLSPTAEASRMASNRRRKRRRRSPPLRPFAW